MAKNAPASAGDTQENVGSTPGSGRSPGVGNGNPLQYSRLGNPTDTESLKSLTQLSTVKEQEWEKLGKEFGSES